MRHSWGSATFVIAAAAVATLSVLGVAPALSAPPPVEAFARLPKAKGGSIAPDGRHLAVRVEQDGRYVMTVFAYDGDSLAAVRGFTEDDEFGTNWVEWMNADRLLVSVRFAARRYGTPTTETRLLSATTDGFKLKPMFRPEDGALPEQIQDNIVSFLPKDPDHILVQYINTGRWPSVYRVKADSTRHRLAQGYRRGVLSWGADQDGDVRYGYGSKDNNQPYMVMRPKTSKQWIDYSYLRMTPGREFRLAAFSSEPDEIYAISNHDQEPSGLFRFNVATGEFGELVFRHPTADVAGVIMDRVDGSLRGVWYSGDEPQVYWYDER
ncbi:MAG: hypothetical protein AAGL49_13490, partial [Pseudomonadota bacterium]